MQGMRPFTLECPIIFAMLSALPDLKYRKKQSRLHWVCETFRTFAARFQNNTLMSYSQMAQLELMNAAANVTSQDDLDGLHLGRSASRRVTLATERLRVGASAGIETQEFKQV